MTDLNSQLKDKIDEVNRRTAELQAANKELEAFSYTVSHDLRAPLRAINGFSAILMEEHADQLSPQGKEFLQRIADGGQRMGALVDDLLAFSRLSRQALRTQEVQTKQVVQRAWDQLSTSMEGRQ